MGNQGVRSDKAPGQEELNTQEDQEAHCRASETVSVEARTAPMEGHCLLVAINQDPQIDWHPRQRTKREDGGFGFGAPASHSTP